MGHDVAVIVVAAVVSTCDSKLLAAVDGDVVGLHNPAAVDALDRNLQQMKERCLSLVDMSLSIVLELTLDSVFYQH